MSIVDRQIALAGLLRLCEPPVPAPVTSFVAAVGVLDAWQALLAGLAPAEVVVCVAPRIAGRTGDQLTMVAEADLTAAAAVGAGIHGPGDDDWPTDSFAPLSWVPPYEKCRHASPPIALYRRGDLWPAHAERAVAVVGSRAATSYGVRVAAGIAADAGDAGAVVVSGAAFGIDAAAHRGALGAGAATVAVLASGIDRPYPAAHRGLIDEMARSGSVVSEYPPGATPARHRFLVRNRLIAAFAGVTVVIEAGRRSGSLNTATTAANLGRHVAAVPGAVSSAMSVGCHDLIQRHRADLVTSWADVEALTGPIVPDAVVHRHGGRPTDGLDLVTGRVHDALPARGTATLDEIAVEAGLPAGDVLAALAVLQTDGLARRQDGQWARGAARLTSGRAAGTVGT